MLIYKHFGNKGMSECIVLVMHGVLYSYYIIAHSLISTHYTWLAYLLEEHAILDCIALSLRSINGIEHAC